MIGSGLMTYAISLLMWTGADGQAVSEVVVLDGPEVQHVRDALNRVTCPFRGTAKLDSATLAGCQVLVLSGKKPPLGLISPNCALPKCIAPKLRSVSIVRIIMPFP